MFLKKQKEKVVKVIKTRKIVYTSLQAVFLAILSQIIIPIGVVPVNLTTAGVMVSGGVLGKKYGTLSVAVYILLGAVGVPVFSAFRGGLGVIAGPTGGFIIGYLPMVFIVGVFYDKFKSIWAKVLGMLIATTVCYGFGTVGYSLITHTPVVSALAICVLPFVVGDILKIIASVILIKKLKPRLYV